MKNVRVNAIWPGELLENAGYSLVYDSIVNDLWAKISNGSNGIWQFAASAILFADETD